MMGWLRRVRGAIGMGLTWAVGWSPVGALMGAVLWALYFDGWGIGPGTVVGGYTGLFAGLGFLGGAIFSMVLRIAEGRRRFDQLTLPRFALWGGVGGLILGVLTVTLPIVGFSGVTPLTVAVAGAASLLGAGSAAGTLALARRAAAPDRIDDGTEGGGLLGS